MQTSVYKFTFMQSIDIFIKTAKLEPVCLPWQKLTELLCWASNNQVEFTHRHTAFLSMGFHENKVLICKATYQTHLWMNPVEKQKFTLWKVFWIGLKTQIPILNWSLFYVNIRQLVRLNCSWNILETVRRNENQALDLIIRISFK